MNLRTLADAAVHPLYQRDRSPSRAELFAAVQPLVDQLLAMPRNEALDAVRACLPIPGTNVAYVLHQWQEQRGVRKPVRRPPLGA